MKRNGNHIKAIKANSTKSCSTKARDLTHKMAIIPNWQSFCPHPRKYTSSRPHSSPGRVYSKNGFQNMFRPSSSTTTVANPILSFLDVKRILFQKITDKRDELKKAFQLLDTGQNLTVSKSELRRTIAAFLLPLTREQFQEVLAQVPVTGSGNVPYLEFLSRFGGIDLNINTIKRGGVSEANCHRTLKDLEVQVAEKVFWNMKTITKAFKLIDVNKTGLVQPQELKRLLETFCLKMTDEEYERVLSPTLCPSWGLQASVLWRVEALYLHMEIPRENQQAKLSRREHLPSFVASDSIWDNCSLDDIERTFCREFSKSHEKVEKALSAGDPSKGGYVSLNYLKVVLDTFVYWLPRRIFLQLMKRFGLKTTSKINWKHFLASFNEPQEFEVSYMVSSKKPSSLGSRNQPQKESIVTKLFRHGEDSYMALKKALLIINTVRFETLLIEKLIVSKKANTQSKTNKNSVFTHLSIQRTFLSSCYSAALLQVALGIATTHLSTRRTLPCAESKMPLHLAWNSVEEMVQDAITRHLQAFYDTLQSYDLRDTGTISRSNFKKIMHTFCPFLTNEHLTKLSSKFQDTVSGRILYKKFLACVGIKDLPTMPPICVSKDKSSEHFQKEQQPLPDLSERGPGPRPQLLGWGWSNNQGGRWSLSSGQGDQGLSTLTSLRQVLEDSGMPMDDTQFSQLTTKIGFKKEGMSYLDFAAGFEAEECLKLFPRRLKEHFQAVGEMAQKSRTKQKVADSELACEQAHQYLVIKAKNRWADLSKNFLETDNEGNGILRRRDIKNALYGFDIPLTPREFEKLWQSYDTEGRGHITYQEFLQKLGLRYSPTVHRPYAEDYFNFLGHFTKPQQVQEEIQELQQSTERAVPARAKLEDHYQDISKALTTLDKSKSGSVSLCKLRKVLRDCGCPLKEVELSSLLNSWGISQQDNSVNYLDFLRALEKRALEKSQLGSPQSRDQEGSLPINFSTLSPEEIVRNMQEAVESAQPALLQAFSALDKEDTGFVNATEFGQVLKDVCCQLSDNQYHYFLRKLRIHLVPYINWKYFLETFSSFLEETADEWAEKMPRIPTSSSPGDMANRDILERLHRAVASHPHTIAQELENFDTTKTNTVSRDEFRAVCARHVQILTDEQFDRLWSEMPVNAKGRLKYPDFLSRFGSEQAATPPVSNDSTRAQRGSSVPVVLERTRSTVSSPTHDLKVGSKSRSLPCVSSQTAKAPATLLDPHGLGPGCSLPGVQAAKRLGSGEPGVGDTGRGFLWRTGCEEGRRAVSTGVTWTLCWSAGVEGGGPHAEDQGRSVEAKDTRTPGSYTLSTPCHHSSGDSTADYPGPWASPGALSLSCGEPGNCHRRPAVVSAALAEKFNLDMSKEESQQLVLKYDLKNNGRFAYCDFIQSCVLLLKAKETALMHRMRIQNAQKMVSFLSFWNHRKAWSLDLGPRVLARAQVALPRALRSISLTPGTVSATPTGAAMWGGAATTETAECAWAWGGAGGPPTAQGVLPLFPQRHLQTLGVPFWEGCRLAWVTVACCVPQVLRQYSINLSEEEFFHVLEYYDKTLSSRVAYNDFLRAFLQ
uniref:EF-hand calcium-binding domain-containing protein 6 n=1 Tax=Ictidomys tridecemlineatus TaxID=43179 RepID=UPI001A9D6DEF|nr:EF-hand calcium-binding domain-containing protein 6 [Ictidomys tridecemlineatus]